MEPLTRKEFFLNAIAEGTPTPPPLTREERYLAKIAENTVGDSLPPIEEGDDGKVLTASDGEAVWASGGGGSSDPYSNYDAVFTCDKSGGIWELAIIKGNYADLVSKITSGEPITAAYLTYNTSENINEMCFVYSLFYDDEANKIIITIHDFDEPSNFAIVLESDNIVDFYD